MGRQAEADKTPALTDDLQKKSAESAPAGHPLLGLQRSNGNQAVQRLVNSPTIQPQLLPELQRLIGNQAVQRLIQSRSIQAELLVSKPGDRLAREAAGTEEKEQAVAGNPVVQRAPLVVRQDARKDKIARKSDDESDITADEYQKRFADEIGNGVVAAIKALPLEIGSRYLTLASPLLLGPALLGDSGAVLTGKIDGWLGGLGKLGVIINKARPKGRVEVTDEKTTWVEDKQGEGPARWFPDVAVEVAQVVHKLLHESLARIVPRYIQAAVAVGLAEEERQHKSLLTVPAPKPGDIVPSHPIDRNTIGVLTHFARFDYNAYRAANPTERGKIGVLRPIAFAWEAPRTGSYWIRVTSPADPTPEEVALALYGSPTFAGEITVAAAPLFGITYAGQLLPAHQQALAALGVDTGRVADPVKEALTGPLHDEVAKNQSKGPTSLLTKADVVRTIDQSVMILDTISKSGARFGMDKGPYVESVGPLKKKLKDRRTTLMAGTDEQALTWASQAEAQQAVLSDISFAFDRHVTRLNDLTKMVKSATEKLGAFNLPDYVRMAMLEVAMKFADAAVASEFPATARATLAQAEDRAGTLPVEFLEGALASIQRVIDDARTAKAGLGRWVTYDLGGMQAREQSYKLQLAKIRALIRTDPAAATKELGEVQKLILDLQTESELVGNMDAIDSTWKALDDAYSFWFSSIGTKLTLQTLKAEGDAFHAKWNAIHTAWKSGDPKAKEKAKTDLDALRADPKLPVFFGKVKEAVKDAQTEALIGKLVALLAITVVTMGVGDVVAAGALGWELGAGATAAVVGGAEAFTFTLLSQIFLDADHSFGHIVYEFGTNWLMFGVMRRFQAFAEVAKLGTVAKFGGQAMLLGAMTYAKADLDVYIKEGRHLNKEEVKQIALQGIAMYIAMHAIAPAAKPLFADLESSAYTFTAKLKANNRTRIALETQANALKGTKDFGAAQKYVAAEKAWLEEKIKVLDEVEAQLKKEEADPSKTKKGGGLGDKIKLNSKDLASLQSEMKANLAKVEGAEQPLLYLEPKAPGLFSCPREHIADVVKSLGETKNVAEDPVTGVKTYDILTPDGNRIKVVEAVDPKTQWIQDLRAGLDGVQRARFDLMTAGMSPHEVYDRFGGSIDRAKATAAGVELPKDLLDLRGTLSDNARVAFDAKFRSSLIDPAKPTAKEVETFRKGLETTKKNGGGDLQKGLEAEAATMKKPFDPTGCFVAGTVVWTTETPRPIETLAADDLVLSTDTWNFARSAQPVSAAIARTVSSLVDIDFGGTTISCSAEHPFYVPHIGWRRAGALEAGVELLAIDGPVAIAAVRHRDVDAEVFNLEVAGLSTYHVSALGIFVHNKANAHYFYKNRKAIVEALEANAKAAAELDAAMSQTGEAGKVDATKRTDLAERLAKLKKDIASAKKSTEDLTLGEDELIEPAREEQAKYGDELDALTRQIGEAKKPFDVRMRELNDGIASLDKRVGPLAAKNDATVVEAQKAKAAAGSDKDKVAESEKKASEASTRVKKIFALKERIAALKRNAATVREDSTSDSGIGAYKDEVGQVERLLDSLEEQLLSEGMMGAKGPRFFSDTFWTGPDGYERIDAENPDPGGRPGQIHYQPAKGVKWYYKQKGNYFYNENTGERAPKSVQDKLNDPEIRAAIDKALRRLEGKP